jgi:hypothetical protein
LRGCFVVAGGFRQSAPSGDLIEDVLVVFGDEFDGVAADGEVDGWLVGVGEFDEDLAELGGISFLGVVDLRRRPPERLGRGYVVGVGALVPNPAEDGSRKSVRR